ncbi:hypothetical protein D3C87_1952880 [compost metagenome]
MLGAVAVPLVLVVFLVVLAADDVGRSDKRWDAWRKAPSWWRVWMSIARIAFFAAMGHVALAALLMFCGLVVAGIRVMVAPDGAGGPRRPGAMAASS